MLLSRILLGIFLVLATVYLAGAEARYPTAYLTQTTDGFMVRLEVAAEPGTRAVSAALSNGQVVRLRFDRTNRRWFCQTIATPRSVTLQGEGQRWATIPLDKTVNASPSQSPTLVWGHQEPQWDVR